MIYLKSLAEKNKPYTPGSTNIAVAGKSWNIDGIFEGKDFWNFPACDLLVYQKVLGGSPHLGSS